MPRRQTKTREFRSSARTAPGVTATLKRLGRRIRELRRQADLTQEAAASAAKIDAKHLQAVEAGATNATIATLIGIARALGVRLADLVEGS